MASKRMLVFVTMLFFLSCCISIRAQDPSKHLLIDNGLKLGFTSGPPAIKSAENSTSGGSIKAEQMTYVHNAGYRSSATRWHGVRANIDVWEIPHVQPLSSSGAYIAAINKSPELEYIAAGVHVIPSLYQDNDVHFFTSWTNSSDFTTGCFNDYCPGFIVAKDSNLVPGQALPPPHSTYGGEQRKITIRIKKDEHTGDWSLYREDLGGPIGGMTLLGWWPSSLFKYLSDHAEMIEWTGVISHNYNERSPSMGSGHFSSELEGKAAAFNDCFGFDENGHVYKEYYNPIPYEDKPDCYDVSKWYETKHAARRHFFYGGPGGCFE